MKALETLLWTAGAFALLLGAIVLFQDRLLYLPARASVAQMTAGGLRAWPAETDFLGLVAEPAGPARGTAIVFHGNAGHAGHRDAYAGALTALGLRVILAEYPGYGPRDGSPDEAAFVADARRTIALAHRLHGAPLLLVGESLGAGVAAAAAAHDAALVHGLLLITPWDRLEHVAGLHYPWLPVRWLLRDRYDSAAHLAGFAGPVLVAVAEQDRIVPARFGRALHDGLRSPRRLIVVKDADHNDWLVRVDAAWWRDALDFLLPDGRQSVPAR